MRGYEAAKYYFNEAEGDSNGCPWKKLSKESEEIDIETRRKNVLKRGEFKRNVFFSCCQVNDWMIFDSDMEIADVHGVEHYIHLSNVYDVSVIDVDMACELYDIGLNEFLDMVAPYQERDIVPLFMKD